MTNNLSFVSATVMPHGREIRLVFRRTSEWDNGTPRPLPILRPSRTVVPVKVKRIDDASHLVVSLRLESRM
jgi:hypothetical protein